jgi:hypothetical protein
MGVLDLVGAVAVVPVDGLAQSSRCSLPGVDESLFSGEEAQ